MKKCVLVTGSSKGIGKEIIKKFASNGYNVIINYNTDFEGAEKLRKYVIEKYNVNVLVLKCDVSKTTEVEEMIKESIDTFGKIDVLINNAAIEYNSDFFDKTEDSFRKVLDVNVIGTFLVTKCVAKEMLKQNSGVIINITSNNAINKFDPSTLEYDASKAAIISLTHNFAKEFAPYLRVNAVAPGWVETDKIKKLDEELGNQFIKSESKNILLNRFAREEEIANLVYFLSSDEASYINGEVIKIDGGSL